MRYPGSIPRDSPASVVLLHWWPRRDWSLWPCLRRSSSQTITRPSCRQCDNPTLSHTALLSRFHARCRSSFRFHNRHSRLLGGGSPMESLQSHCIHTQFHWSSGPPVCFPSWGTRVQSPGGHLCETGILLLALSRYNFPFLYFFFPSYSFTFFPFFLRFFMFALNGIEGIFSNYLTFMEFEGANERSALSNFNWLTVTSGMSACCSPYNRLAENFWIYFSLWRAFQFQFSFLLISREIFSHFFSFSVSNSHPILPPPRPVT